MRRVGGNASVGVRAWSAIGRKLRSLGIRECLLPHAGASAQRRSPFVRHRRRPAPQTRLGGNARPVTINRDGRLQINSQSCRELARPGSRRTTRRAAASSASRPRQRGPAPQKWWMPPARTSVGRQGARPISRQPGSSNALPSQSSKNHVLPCRQVSNLRAWQQSKIATWIAEFIASMTRIASVPPRVRIRIRSKFPSRMMGKRRGNPSMLDLLGRAIPRMKMEPEKTAPVGSSCTAVRDATGETGDVRTGSLGSDGCGIGVRHRLPRRPGSHRLATPEAFRASLDPAAGSGARFRRAACDAAKPACLVFPSAVRRERAA